MATVDAIVVTHNNALTIGACLASLDCQSHVPNVFVIDTCSADDTLEAVLNHGLTATTVTNRGFGAACNEGARLGSAPVLFFINPDARLLPGALDRMVLTYEEMASEGGSVMIGPWIGGPSVDRDPNYWSWIYPSSLAIRRRLFRGTSNRPWASATEPSLRKTKTISGAAFLMSREDFEHLGGFDERFFLYFEDADLARRARRLGVLCLIDARARVVHEGGRSTSKLRDLGIIQAQSNVWFARKHHGRLGGLICTIDLGVTTLLYSAIELLIGRGTEARRRLRRLYVIAHPFTSPQLRPAEEETNSGVYPTRSESKSLTVLPLSRSQDPASPVTEPNADVPTRIAP